MKKKRPNPRHARERSSFSPSMFLTRAIGVIFPLVAIAIFVFSMGNMACTKATRPPPSAACSPASPASSNTLSAP